MGNEGSCMMPRWLQLWLGLSLFCAWAAVLLVAVPFVISQMVSAGEPAFTDEQATYLRESFPGGTFEAQSRYKWCDGRVFMYFDSRGDAWNHGESCWRP